MQMTKSADQQFMGMCLMLPSQKCLRNHLRPYAAAGISYFVCVRVTVSVKSPFWPKVQRSPFYRARYCDLVHAHAADSVNIGPTVVTVNATIAS